MKKNLMFAMFGAIALTGSVGLTACSESEDVVDVNPTFDGESVKAQFTISFPQDVAKTRQTAGTVQNGQAISDFRGMDNIVLYPFAATAGATENPVASSSTKLADAITLSKMLKPTEGAVNNSIPAGTTGLMATNNSVLFGDVTIPVGTGSFLFYGKAIDNTTHTDKFYNGSLKLVNTSSADPQAAVNPDNIAFDLDLINPFKTISSTGTALANYLSQIAQAGGMDATDTDKSQWEKTTNTGLKDLYDKFITLKAGSSMTAQAAVQDLYLSIWKSTDQVALAIATAITTTYATANSTTGVLTFDSSINGFPGDVSLPDGAAYLTYNDGTNTFSQSTDGASGSNVTAAYDAYVYPASLYYYGNSGVKTATSSQASLYDDTNTWGTIIGNAAFTGNSVGPSTRSVAIIDPIQYGVGRLDMTVSKLPNAEMYDKKGDAYDATAGFDITGVFIGGQRQVGFNFTTNTSATEKTIFDDITKSQPTSTLTVTPSAASGTNYTLALETVKDQDVYVAVEFLNNGADFEGRDGVIPAGCKFYLVGKLIPTAVTGVTGYNATNLNQVFKQDHKTVVTFSIAQGTPGTTNTTGLGAAYNTIPDLRTPQLELGLSVNLHWETGLEFANVNLGQ